MESTDSSNGSQQPHLPPGFRFHPTDEELVVHYLKKKAASAPLPVSIIADVDLYKFDPWQLPAMATFGEHEWYFFSPRDRKYPNGARPNRAATSGYWKATGTDKPVFTSGGQKVGVKKALVFYGGKPPKGIKSNWIMHEYRIVDNKSNSKPPACDFSKKGSLRLDDWVLCRIYKKTNTPRPVDHESDNVNDQMMQPTMPSLSINDHPKLPGLKTMNYGGLQLDNEQHMFDGMLNSNGRSISQHLPMIGGLSHILPPPKRTFTAMYWNDENGNTSPPPPHMEKRYITENSDGTIGPRSTDDETTNSMQFASLMGGQTQIQQPAMLGPLGDHGMFRQVPGINWYN